LYLKKIWIGSNLAFQKCWQTDEAKRVLTGDAAGKLADFCSCWFRAFVAGPQLTYEAGSVDGDYDSLTNRTDFEKWAKETLFPNTPEESVVVFDSAPFHYVQADKLQSEYTVKAEMISRLRRQKIGFMPIRCNISCRAKDYSVHIDKKKTYRFIQNKICHTNTNVFSCKSYMFRSRYRPSTRYKIQLKGT
jgi:hypothetical protein